MVRLISAWWVLWCCLAAGSVPRHTALPRRFATPAPARSVIVNGMAAQTNADFTFARSGVGLVNGQNIFTNVAQNLYGVRVTYTRGADLSGTMQGAGGIGGLLARTDASGSAFYHADGAGNITGLMDRDGDLAARYLYGPFGRLVGKWGPMADANAMQFSAMPSHANSGLSLYPFRNYDANLQRWLTRDPIGEAGGINLYGFVANNPIGYVDPLGEDFHLTGASGLLTPGPLGYLSGDTASEQVASALYNTIPAGVNLLSSAGQGLLDGLGVLDQATKAGLTALSGGDEQLGGAANSVLAVAPLGLPGRLANLGKLGKAAVKCEKAAETIDASAVRFSQSSISRNFSAGGTIDDLAAGLRNGSVNPANIPPIRLVEQEGNLFTLDNRRLWSFQQAQVPVPYRMATPQEAAAEAWKFTTKNGGTSIRVRGQ